MNERSKRISEILRKKREKKRLTRLRKGKKYLEFNSVQEKLNNFNKDNDSRTISDFNYPLDDFIDENSTITKVQTQTNINIPKDFSLEYNYTQTIDTITLIRKSIIKYSGNEIVIDFTNCKFADFAVLFILKILLDEYIKLLNKLDSKLNYYTVAPKIKIKHSKTDKVNLKLLANNIIPNTNANDNTFIPISLLNLIKGSKSQKHYAENKKGIAVTKIRKFINDVCLRNQNLMFNENGVDYLDGMLSEILNNAEDHSISDNWYVFGNLFETTKTKEYPEIIGEINLAIVNFGISIYDGFEYTKEKNKETYEEMELLYNHILKIKKSNYLSKENLFTLYALQEGKSRLKYERKSRGTGTMKFIQSFLGLGDYEDKKNGFTPRLIIYSGSTFLKCDNKYRPYVSKGVNYISLNKENDLLLPPSESHLNTLDRRFPGTLLVVKIYLNENHLKTKIENNGKN